MEIAVGWWLAAADRRWLGRRNMASPPIALLADAKMQMSLPELRPGLTLLNRLWPLLFSTLGGRHPRGVRPAGVGGRGRLRDHLGARVAAAGGGGDAIEDRDGFRFYVDKTPPLSPIRLIHRRPDGR